MAQETDIENSLITFLDDNFIRAKVKSDRYSLPYQNEIVSCTYSDLFYKVHKELVDNNVSKIRFYIDVKNLEDGLKYYFRYYVHENMLFPPKK